MLRVFALADGAGSWRVLPGGLVRLAQRGELIASMQRGGSSADCWVLTDGPVDHTSLLQSAPTTLALAQQKRPVTSRAAENLFWLGRYTERAENSLRLAQIVLNHLGGEEPNSRPLMAWLTATATENSLVSAEAPAATAVTARVRAQPHGRALTHSRRPAVRQVAQRGLQSARAQGRRLAGARAPVAGTLAPDRAHRIQLRARLCCLVHRRRVRHRRGPHARCRTPANSWPPSPAHRPTA